MKTFKRELVSNLNSIGTVTWTGKIFISKTRKAETFLSSMKEIKILPCRPVPN